MSDSERFAHYKRTAPYGDLEFFLRVARLSPALRKVGDDLMTFVDAGGRLQIPRAEFYRRLVNLHGAWRRESNARQLTRKPARKRKAA